MAGVEARGHVVDMRYHKCLGVLAIASLATLAAHGSARAQSSRPGPGAGPAIELGRFGAAHVLEFEGPPLPGRREFYRPVPPLTLHHRWIVVQDSTFGVVFAGASGVRPDLSDYVGDVYLHSLDGVKAVEVRALVFDVWGEPSGYLTSTVLTERRAGDSWDVHPRWRVEDASTAEHRTSIVWINRVMFDDESILEADPEPIAAAWTRVTGQPFDGLPEDVLQRAIEP